MNALQHERSPYLLQHAHNPVQWYAWKPEAFRRAQEEQKPILVSIGYSTCHWCHVMERESFENAAVAAIMNRYFINIKVDREERPDVDAIYMEACQLMTGSGGWPLNCFLTPDGKPFYAGTYFPPAPAYNRPSWTQLLTHLADVWENKRDLALEQAERLTSHLQKDAPPLENETGAALPNPDAQAVFEILRGQFDLSCGGFGGAPKFPSSMAIQFLLEYFAAFKQPEALSHALFSLEKMAESGIFDQIGGGFARYATDREWNIPHFEKMLYDNALLVSSYSAALRLLRDERLLDSGAYATRAQALQSAVEETLAFIDREMTGPEGGFYSAQDADSEGVEGKFYVWTKTEIMEALGGKGEEFCARYSVTDAGNWEGVNILFRQGNQRGGQAERQKLLEIRNRRIRPLLDDKIMLDWNALMCSAYAAAFHATGHAAYRDTALRSLQFMLHRLRNAPEAPGALPALRHSEHQDVAFLDDYAFFIAALIDSYQISFDPEHLLLAGRYTERALELFSDPEDSLLFFSKAGQEDLLLRKKDFYDNATPSGNSVMLHNLQRLGWLLDRPDWRARADQMLQSMQLSYSKFPLSFANWALGMLHAIAPPAEIAVLGPGAVETALKIQNSYLPNSVVCAADDTDSRIPLLADKTPGDPALIYLCRNFACQRPVVSLEAFFSLLAST